MLNWSHDLNNDSGKTYASVLVEPDVDNQKAAAILEEKAIMIEEDHAQPTVFTAQSEPEVKMPLHQKCHQRQMQHYQCNQINSRLN